MAKKIDATETINTLNPKKVKFPTHQTSERSKSTHEKNIKRECRWCGKTFYSRAKNTLYCDDCAQMRRSMQNEANTVRRRDKNNMAKYQRKNQFVVEVDGTMIGIPNSYYNNAFNLLASYLGLSYGKAELWKTSHEEEFAAWCRKMAKDYAEQKSNLKYGEPRTPSRDVFKEYRRSTTNDSRRGLAGNCKPG